MQRGEINLTADMIYGFVSTVLMASFDAPQPIPSCHLEWWDLITTNEKKVAIAAPRGHAKTTAITHSFVLAAMLFRFRDHCMIVSDSEDQACAFLGDIKMELEENEKLRILFGVNKLIKDSTTEAICLMNDGHKFRIIARGSQQKLRGLKWRHRRPNLIVGDDLENDEMVMNQERREKFKNWFMGALLPAGSDDCIFRIVGTILHLDSMLERLMPPIGDNHTIDEGLRSRSNKPNRAWKSYRYKAHDEDFSNILWPEKFSKERLEAERQDYIDQGYPEGYAQEYLNYPIDESTAYFRRDDFNFYSPEELVNTPLSCYSAVDFAISERQRADYTAIVTVGVDSDNKLYVLDCKRGRWDSKEIIDNIFFTHLKYKPEAFIAEDGMIKKSIGPFLNERMMQEGVFINIQTESALKDKQSRARSIQARMRVGSVYFNKEADYYPALEQELLRFPRDVHDDQVDALAWIGLVLDKMVAAPTKQELEDEEWEEFVSENQERTGMCAVTGY